MVKTLFMSRKQYEDNILFKKEIESNKTKFDSYCQFGKKYYYKLVVTIGFIIGFVLDQILVGTFGYPVKLLKKYGKCLYSREIRSNLVRFKFVRGFLE